MKTSDIVNHFTELDRVRFENTDEYVKYFDYLKGAFTLLLDSITERTTEDLMEVGIIKTHLQKFLNTIEILRLKYLFESDDKMLIDLTDSGFPNHYELRKMFADIDVAAQKLTEYPSKDTLKMSVLDYIFKNNEKPKSLLKQLGRVEYYHSLTNENLFKDFNTGSLSKVSENDKVRSFVYNWSSYDSVTNRPFIYILFFDHDRNAKDAKDLNEIFVEKIQKLNHDTAPLRVMAHDIDVEFESISPKVLKRIDIGPIYGHYSKEGNPISEVVQKEFSKDDYAFMFTNETIFSVGEKRNNSFFSKGELRQIFFIDESDKEALDRNVSKVSKYMIASHSLVQYLNDHQKDFIDELAIAPITFVSN